MSTTSSEESVAKQPNGVEVTFSPRETSKLVKKTTFSVEDEKDNVVTYEPEKSKETRFNIAEVGGDSEPSSPTSPSSPRHDTVLSTNQMTADFLQPKTEYYRMTNPRERPPIDSVGYKRQENEDVEKGQDGPNPLKFGWIVGVLVRCVLNIWGVMLFLRMSYIVGEAGVLQTVLIILMSTVVTTLTTTSMSAICTNGVVKGGGAYYLISRSLGPEFGGAIGIIFSLANAIAVALYVVGFAETVRDLMREQDFCMICDAKGVWDVRIIGTITLILLLGITQAGMAWESKAQLGLLAILIISILNFLIGTFITHEGVTQKKADGFHGYNSQVFAENWGSSYRNENFMKMFALFFPAATGILAGCNISGDLKDAQKAIPKGTFIAIAITSTVYIIIAFILGAIQLRDATGQISDFIGVENATKLCEQTSCQFGWDFYTPDGASWDDTKCLMVAPPNNETLEAEYYNEKCSSGLLNDKQAMAKISLVSYIITAGIFAATLSSALASLVSAPKIFQAVCKDKIFPVFNYFAKGTKKDDEPRRAFVLAFLISLGFILIGELDTIAPIISNFFLASYTLINFSCFSSSLSKSPGWRPAYKFYNMYVSLAGSVICCAIMFLISWYAGLITIGCIAVIYKYVEYTEPNINWGSSAQAYVYKQALDQALKLNSVEDHVRNFRPSILVLTGQTTHRPALVHLAGLITKNTSLMICGCVKLNEKKYPFAEVRKEQLHLDSQKYKAFYSCITSNSLEVGINSLMQSAGLGKMKANTLMVGFKNDWKVCPRPDVATYTSTIKSAFDMKFGVCILRIMKGLDIAEYLEKEDVEEKNLNELEKLGGSSSTVENGDGDGIAASKVSFKSDHEQVRINPTQIKEFKENKEVVVSALTQIQSKHKGKTVDVWWLTEDGGLTVLLPQIIARRQQWSNCKLRVFTMKDDKSEGQSDYDMARMISKFRIDCQDVQIIDDLRHSKPSDASVQKFEDGMQEFRTDDPNPQPWQVSNEEFEKKKDKTLRFIRLQELLQKNSKEAALIFVTLPLFKDIKSSALYMAWLDEISRDLPPVVLIRGNQTSVLTYYS